MIDAIVEVMPQTDPDEDKTWTVDEAIAYYREYNRPQADKLVRSNSDLVRQAAITYLAADPPFDAAPSSEDLDDIRFPESIRSYPCRAVWKDLCNIVIPACMLPLTISSLLGEPDPWDGGTGLMLADFGRLTGCELVHNMSGNLLYLGSESQQRLDIARQCLRKILIHKASKEGVDLMYIYIFFFSLTIPSPPVASKLARRAHHLHRVR